jgi:hypothetical protein
MTLPKTAIHTPHVDSEKKMITLAAKSRYAAATPTFVSPDMANAPIIDVIKYRALVTFEFTLSPEERQSVHHWRPILHPKSFHEKAG